jgi:DNA-binding winged helix-turn-helix (wHTH) protein
MQYTILCRGATVEEYPIVSFSWQYLTLIYKLSAISTQTTIEREDIFSYVWGEKKVSESTTM